MNGLTATSGRRIGYARVSTQGQDLQQQCSVLNDSECSMVFAEKVSSTACDKRHLLIACLEELREGDALVVAKLDRLGRTQSEVVNRLSAL